MSPGPTPDETDLTRTKQTNGATRPANIHSTTARPNHHPATTSTTTQPHHSPPYTSVNKTPVT
jgi:hypothetical protein